MKWISKEFLNQPIVKKHLGLVSVGFLLGILTYGYVHFNGFQNTGEALQSGLLGILLAYAVHYSNGLINAVIPWRKQPGIRLLAGISLHLLIGLLLVFLSIWFYDFLLGNPSLFSADTNDVLTKIGILLFCNILIYNIIYFAFYSYNEYSRGQVMEVKLQRKQTQLQLNALKSQLSPHFLFNSMNTLSSLFQKDTKKAESFIRSLANSYDYVLHTYEAPLVTLEEELEFVEAFCLLMRTRFGEFLKVDVQLESGTLKSKIPPLTLQMLVENAVKHNVMAHDQFLKINIVTSNKELIVSNNKTQKRPKMDSLKIGLRNIASRYDLLTNTPIEVIDTDRFTVKLPLIK